MEDRIASLDRIRGSIVALMALDHFVYFINRFHVGEFWILSPPSFPSPAYQTFRLLSHLCAPGFVFLAGVSLVLFATARGDTTRAVRDARRSLALRGLILLVVVQLVLEQGAWDLGSRGGRGVPLASITYPGAPSGGSIGYLGVIYAIALSTIVGSLIYRARLWLISLFAALSIVASPIALVLQGAAANPIGPVVNALFVPGVSLFFTNYPLFPWLGVFLLGVVMGRKVVAAGDRVIARSWLPGVVALAAGVVLRFVQPLGEFHPFVLSRPMSFLELSKYPPSPAFLGITLGTLGVILAALHRLERSGRLARPATVLQVFGREPLFFYLLHLYAYAALSLVLVFQNRPLLTIVCWLASLAAFYPVVLLYHRGKVAGKVPWLVRWL